MMDSTQFGKVRLTPPRPRAARRLRPALGRWESLEDRCLRAGASPTDLEQYMLELINRARANPAAEGQRLLTLAAIDPLIHLATAGENLGQFYQVISSYPPEPPLAMDPRLIDAARVESTAMLVSNAQQHSPTGFLTNSAVAVDSDWLPFYPTGTGAWATGENIYAYSQGVNPINPTAYADFLEAGFLLDWGNPDFGHLRNILAPSPSQANLAAGVYPYNQAGIGLLTNATPTTPAAVNVGPAIVTQEFGWRQGTAYLTGTFFLDGQGTGFYAPGEGYGGVTVRATGTGGQGTFQTQTWSTGGYSLQLPPGTYVVTASGPLPGVQTGTITIGVDNVAWGRAFSMAQLADIPVPADYDGIGRAEVAAYRPANGLWMIDSPTTGYRTVQFGQAGDIPVPGHYDAGGRAEIAVYRPSNGTWYVLGPSGGSAFQFGQLGDVPVPGDYDGDGRTDFAVYRPSVGVWFIWRSSSRSLQLTQWGIPLVDQPVPAAYDGGGRAEIAVLRPTTYQWFILGPNGLRVTQFGGPGMVPVPGDYDGVGRAEVAAYQPSSGNWYVRDSGRVVAFGRASVDSPAPADYNGDGQVDFAVFRTITAEWFAQKADGTVLYDQVGQGGTPLTLRAIQGTMLGVPWFWAPTVASPGGTQTTSANPNATGVALPPITGPALTLAPTSSPAADPTASGGPATLRPAVRVTSRRLTRRHPAGPRRPRLAGAGAS